MKLQAELVEVDQRDFADWLDDIKLDEELLGFGCLFLPDGFLERNEPIVDKPSKRHGAIIHDSGWGARLPQLLCDLTLQRFASFGLRHLRFEPENDWNANGLQFVRGRVIYFLAVIPDTTVFREALHIPVGAFIPFVSSVSVAGRNGPAPHFIGIRDRKVRSTSPL